MVGQKRLESQARRVGYNHDKVVIAAATCA
jgi:hypothetical protein